MRKNTDRSVSARRATIARLHLEGYSGKEIASKADISESQVSRDIKAIAGLWRETAIQDIGERKAQDLAELTLVRRELWSAWHSSKKGKADPRYLAEVLKALKQVAELLGYHADQRIKIDYSNLSDDQLDRIIETIIESNHENTQNTESES